MEIIQEIGSYAGLAAIVGLAVLSALYFSQARDVKRLREWAGRAPERAAQPVQPAVPQRVVAQPQPKPASVPVPVPGAPQPTPGQQPGAPAPAIAAAAGARPATATSGPAIAASATAERPGGPGAATPAAQGKQAPADGQALADGPEKQEDGAKGTDGTTPPEPAPGTTGPQAGAEPQASAGVDSPPAAPSAAASPAPPATPVPPPGAPPSAPGTPEAGAAGGSRAATPAGQARPTPPAPPRLARSAPPRRPVPQETAIIPPGTAGTTRAGGLPRSRIVALAVAGVLVLGGGAAFAVSQLTGDEEKPATGRDGGAADDGRDDSGASGGRAVNPADVTVAVLNGTLVPGLAAGIGDEAERLGFNVGVLGNAADQEQQRAESVVLYAKGHRREAIVVSRRLKIPQREAIDPDTQALAGDATVVVIAGGDQTP